MQRRELITDALKKQTPEEGEAARDEQLQKEPPHREGIKAGNGVTKPQKLALPKGVGTLVEGPPKDPAKC